jgi:sigma-B regulation protein RsbU (phosphoserine phosphatase)
LPVKHFDVRSVSSLRAHLRSYLPTACSLLVGLIGLRFLGYQLASADRHVAWLSVVVFAALSFLVQRSSFHLSPPSVPSLAGVIDVAALLALGPVDGALVAVLSGVTYLESSALRHRKFARRYLLEIPLFNAGLKALMVFLGASLYLRLGGPLPLLHLDLPALLATGALCVAWFVLDHLGWGLWDLIEGGGQRLRSVVQDAFPRTVLIELFTLPFSVLIALAYTRLDWPAFGLMALVIASVALLAQRWADARSELLQRVAELSTIEQVGRTIAQAQLDVDEICQLMYQWAGKIADATFFHLGLFDGDDYTLRLLVREGEVLPPRTLRMAPGIGLVTWIRESKQPLLVRDLPREIESLPARPIYLSDNPPRSALYVPLLAGDLVIGTLSLQSFRRNAYGKSDLRVLWAMASQAAVAIQKAQLYAQEQKKARQLETIGQVSRQVTATLELHELFTRMAGLIRANFGYYHVAVYTADPERKAVSFQASASAGDQDVAFDVKWGEGLIGWVAAHGQAVTVNDVENDTRYRCIDALDETQSELVVPLLLEGEPVGVLDVQSDRIDAFGPDDLFILETLGAQIAVAIQAARLYEAEQQQAWFSTALLQVADAMSQVSSMDDVLSSIVRLTPILAGVDRCAVFLWDVDAQIFTPAETYGFAPDLRETLEQMEFPEAAMPALDLVRWGKTHLLVDTTSDSGLVPASMVDTFDIQQMALLPLLAQGELLGVMMVDYAGKPHDFNERLLGMLVGIANQAAMVLEIARLVQAQQEEAYVSMALLQVSEAVSRSTDLEETLATVVRITPILVGVETCALLLWDSDAATFLPYHQYGLKGEHQVAFWQLYLEQSDPLVRELNKEHRLIDLQELPCSPNIVAALGRGALLALPISTKQDLLGIMFVEYAGPGPQFTQRWMNILSGIAGQAAIAIENDRLLQEAAEQERMKQELAVAQRIQASFLPEGCPHVSGWELAAIWRSARQVSGDFYDFIPLPPRVVDQGTAPDRMGLVIADVADKGVPAALFMALSRTLVRTMAIDGRPPALAISRANELILADARSGLFVTLFYTILEAGSDEITFVNAGHVPPLIVRADSHRIEELRVPGIALGILENIQAEEHTAFLGPGDLLVLYTDGVTDAADAGQQRFGAERLRQVLSTHRLQSAEELANRIWDAVATFVGGAAQFDDFTLVIARRQPNN